MKNKLSLHKSIATTTMIVSFIGSISPAVAYSLSKPIISEIDIYKTSCSYEQLLDTFIYLDPRENIAQANFSRSSENIQLLTDNLNHTTTIFEKKQNVKDLTIHKLNEEHLLKESSLQSLFEQCTSEFFLENPTKSGLDFLNYEIQINDSKNSIDYIDDVIYLSLILMLVSYVYNVN